MAFLGKGMLVTFTEVAQDLEDEFNDWYNREHIDERVNMPGFKRARRYIAADGGTLVKYFATYETEVVEDLSAPAYMELLADQSPWSKKIMAQFTHFDRITCRIAVDRTHGVTGAAGLIRLFPDPAVLRRHYDVVTASEVIEHLRRPAAVFDQFDALLKPGGWLGLSLIHI